MEQLDADLGVIREWRRKCYEHSGQSNDALLSLFAKGFDTIAVIASPSSDSASILRALASLENERTLALQFENKDFEALRYFSFGLIEAFNLLMKIHRGNNSEEQASLTNDTNDQNSNIAPSSDCLAKVEPYDDYYVGNEMFNVNPQLPMEPKVETIDTVQATDNQIQFDTTLNGKLSEEKEISGNIPRASTGDVSCLPIPMEPRDEPVDSVEVDPTDNQIDKNNSRVLMRDDSVEKEEEKVYDHSTDSPKGHSNKTIEVKKRKISSRSVSKPINYADDSEEISEDDSEVDVNKKSRTSSQQKNYKKRTSVDMKHASSLKSKKPIVARVNKTELKCPECECRTRSVCSWINHLKNKHSTTPQLTGHALLCECGNITFSNSHLKICNVANFTVIRKGDMTLPKTPQCILCEKYPKTACSYAFHLNRRHKSTLKKNKIYLKCSCGVDVRINSPIEHGKNCDPHLFTLLKLDEE